MKAKRKKKVGKIGKFNYLETLNDNGVSLANSSSVLGLFLGWAQI